MPSNSFYAYFVHILRCSKQVFQTKIYPKKVSKLSCLCKKRKNCFAFLFWDLRPKSQDFTPHPCPPPFWKFFIKYIEQWTKTLCKKPVDRAGPKPVDRPVNRRWFWNLPVGSCRENPDRFHLWSRFGHAVALAAQNGLSGPPNFLLWLWMT